MFILTFFLCVWVLFWGAFSRWVSLAFQQTKYSGINMNFWSSLATWIWSHLLQKSLTKNVIFFCSVCINTILIQTLPKKWRFSLRVSSVNVTKFTVTFGLVTFTDEILNQKLYKVIIGQAHFTEELIQWYSVIIFELNFPKNAKRYLSRRLCYQKYCRIIYKTSRTKWLTERW